MKEEEYSILRILYCYSLQQHIFLAFCHDFDTHYRMFAYILLRNKTMLFLKSRRKPTHPILHYSLVVNMEKGKFTNFENSYKIDENSYNDNFFALVIRRKRKFILAKQIFGVSGTLNFASYLATPQMTVQCLALKCTLEPRILMEILPF